jgi:acetyl esterase/lipase
MIPCSRALKGWLFFLAIARALACPAQDVFAVAPRIVTEDRYPQRRIEFPDGVIGSPDLTYIAPPGFRPLRLDLYRPAGAPGPRPLVLFVHAGAWHTGDRRNLGAYENWPGVLAALAARGYVVASVEYRLSGEARFPAALDDIRTAIRWLRSRAELYGIDRRRAVVWGGSAGGQLAALAGTACNTSPSIAAAYPGESDCVQGVVAWYGLFDLAGYVSQLKTRGTPAQGGVDIALGRFLGCSLSNCPPEFLALASAGTYVDSTDPPVLLIHGVEDRVAPIQQSRDFVRRLTSRGVAVELLALPGVDHHFIGTTAEVTRDASRQAVSKTFEFIDRTLAVGRSTSTPAAPRL